MRIRHVAAAAHLETQMTGLDLPIDKSDPRRLRQALRP
jgi:hypothetical protein